MILITDSGIQDFLMITISEDDLISAAEPYRYDPGSGRMIGEHNGAHFFTIGQRKGINIGGYKEPLFVHWH